MFIYLSQPPSLSLSLCLLDPPDLVQHARRLANSWVVLVPGRSLAEKYGTSLVFGNRVATPSRQMPLDVEPDEIEDITVGKIVHLMGEHHDIKHNSLGRVIDKDGEVLVVKFSEGTITLLGNDLDMCSYQKGTYVYPGATLDPDLQVEGSDVGEVVGVHYQNGEGLLHVRFAGRGMACTPDMLVKCEFQIGTCVYWTKSDSDIPPSHIGVVVDDLGKKTKVTGLCFGIMLNSPSLLIS